MQQVKSTESQAQSDAENNEPATMSAEQQALSDQEEQQLNRWLRQIPDDPSRLLKNKMLLESKQRGNKTESEQIW